MFAKRKIFSICALAFLLGCSESNRESSQTSSTPQSIEVADTIAGSSGSAQNGEVPERKIIRTANMRFKVKDVFQATHEIEDITARHGGFITLTNLTSSTNDQKLTPITQDSSQEITYYTVANSITLRVPNMNLDSVIRQISNTIDHLDFRVITADDAALQLLANTKAVNRNAKSEARISRAIDAAGKNLKTIVDAEEALLKKNQDVDESDIANLSLHYQINFSTVQLSIYQREATKVETFLTEKDVAAYTPSFASGLKKSLFIGWNILESLLLTLLKVWPLMIIALLVIGFHKRSKFKRMIVAGQSK